MRFRRTGMTNLLQRIGQAALSIFQRLAPAGGIDHAEFAEQARRGVSSGFEPVIEGAAVIDHLAAALDDLGLFERLFNEGIDTVVGIALLLGQCVTGFLAFRVCGSPKWPGCARRLRG